jgi:hypothetical protein
MTLEQPCDVLPRDRSFAAALAAAATERRIMAHEEPVEIYIARDLPEAYFLRGLLEEAGIEARVVDDALNDILGDAPDVAGPHLMVHGPDGPRAREIVLEYEQRQIDRAERTGRGEATEEESFCYECGAPVPRGVSPCPACGKQLDWTDDVA